MADLTYITLHNAGFSDEEISSFYSKKGFSDLEIYQYIYKSKKENNLPTNMAGVRVPVLPEEQRAKAPEHSMLEYVTEFSKGALEEYKGYLDAAEEGFDSSNVGIILNNKLPSEQRQDLSFGQNLTRTAVSVLSDTPIYAVGGKAGGIAGAFALEEGLRSYLMQLYQDGSIKDFDDFWNRTTQLDWGDVAIETGKGAVVGAVTGGASKASNLLNKSLNIKGMPAEIVNFTGELTGLTAGTALTEGEIPSAQDIIDNAALLLTLKGANQLASKIASKTINTVKKTAPAGEKTISKNNQGLEIRETKEGYKVIDENGKNLTRETVDLDTAKLMVDTLSIEKENVSNIVTKKIIQNYVSKGTTPTETVNEVLSDPVKLQNVFLRDKNIDGSDVSIPKNVIPNDTTKTYLGDKTKIKVGDNPEYTGSDIPIKLSDLVRKLQDEFDVPLRTGRMRTGKNVLGFYKVNPEVVRTKGHKDISTILHEIGHMTEDRLFGKVGSDQITKYYEELKGIATVPRTATKSDVSAEGYAEFISYYVIDPKTAKEKAPEFYKFFEKEFPKLSPDWWRVIKYNQHKMQLWQEQPSIMRVTSNIAYTDPKGKISLRDLSDETYTNLVDQYHPLLVLERELFDKPLQAKDSPYILSRLNEGVAGKAIAYLEKGTYDAKLNWNKNSVDKTVLSPKNVEYYKGEPLRKIFKDLSKIAKDTTEFDAYVVSKRALALKRRDIDTGVNLADAKYVVDTYKDKYELLSQRLTQYFHSLADYAYQKGWIKPEVHAYMVSDDTYVSFQRLIEKPKYLRLGLGKNLKASSPFKKIVGSDLDIIPPFESAVKMTYDVIRMSDRNEIIQKLTDFAKVKGSGKYIEKVPRAIEKVKLPEGKSLVEIDDLGNVMLLPENFFMRPTKETDPFIVTRYDLGYPTSYQVNPEIAKVMNGLDNNGINNRLFKLIFEKPTTWTRAGAVLRPSFVIRNFIKDAQSALINSNNKFIPFMDNIIGIAKVAAKSDVYYEWLKSGGYGGSLVSRDRKIYQEKLNDFKKSGYLDRVWNTVNPTNYIQHLRVISELVDEGARVQDYSKSLKRLEKGNKYNAKLQGAYESRELTIDFSRVGCYMKAINQSFVFTNAAIQGTDKKVRMIMERPLKTFAAYAGLATAVAIITVANFDDKRLSDIDPVVDSTHFVIPAGDYLFKIPFPQEWAAELATVKATTRAILSGFDKEDRDKLLLDIASAYETNYPLGIIYPTSLQTPVELSLNKSLYFGTPIVTQDLERLLPEYQYTPRTTETAKSIAAIIGRYNTHTPFASPARIEYAINGFTGGMGKDIMKIMDYFNPNYDPNKDPYKLEHSYFGRSFLHRYDKYGSASYVRFMDNAIKAERIYNTYRNLAKKGDERQEQIEGFVNADIAEIVKIKQYIGQINGLIREIEVNKEMTVDEKRQQIDALGIDVINFSKRGVYLLQKNNLLD